MLRLFDTHTHFDVDEFAADRHQLATDAYHVGVRALILIGFVAKRFAHLVSTQQQLQQFTNVPECYLAPGLHPFYIEQHQPQHVWQLEQLLQQQHCVAIGEIGLDSFIPAHKTPHIRAKQEHLFSQQLELARLYQQPVLLHIRKSHADVLRILKQHHFKHGGIAHAFSGGSEEAKAFIKLGFKLGITGQITNPNAKRLRQVVQQIDITDMVIETDCPDMTPLCCQQANAQKTRNVPANLPYVVDELSQLLNHDKYSLANQLWQNSIQVLNLR